MVGGGGGEGGAEEILKHAREYFSTGYTTSMELYTKLQHMYVVLVGCKISYYYLLHMCLTCT